MTIASPSPAAAPATPASVRDIIVDSADRLYYAKGIQSVGMDELRSAAGVSLKRLYSEFPSKEDIVLAVMERRHELWTTGVSALVDDAETPRDRLLAIYDYLAGWFSDDSFRGCGFINAFGELGGVSPAVATITREHKASFQDYVADLVADAGAPASLAPQLAILAEGAQTTAAITGSPEAALHARRAAETLIDAAS
ncbi:TetR/AcrR family transcriptional regulator [Plantibacter sp. VKM Ac-2885]|uniref:TetR/AcrR family transcriptional regulator n=1 Tax=unclassified Plantibacter TaxID=2624265 RepID=UPI00188AF280|nr:MULTISPECIES: TetR/AcrR family transcriptional regulator [unclassified Plantibacter]MBD8535154.1 TetR/AcrR family transcriptional regulator [Plantibacter sp. CFBP 13570]MBF4513420.1 TetR/AcrR family transcriptional regulator [Plantibacter sp. VKM Ac-2885]